MHFTLLLALVACALPVSAQTMYLQDGQRGVGLFASVSPTDVGTLVGGRAYVPVVFGLDVSAAVSYLPYPDDENPDNEGGVTTYGLGVTYFLDRKAPNRVGVSVGVQNSTDGDNSARALTTGVIAGRQIAVSPGFLIVPQVEGALAFTSGHTLGGVAAGLGLVADARVARFVLVPSVGYGVDSRSTSVGIEGGVTFPLNAPR